MAEPFVLWGQASSEEIQSLADVLNVRVSDLLVSPLGDEEEVGPVVARLSCRFVPGLMWTGCCDLRREEPATCTSDEELCALSRCPDEAGIGEGS